MDEFEKNLSRQIPRRLPAEWRSEILNAADAAREESIAAEKRIAPPEAKTGILRWLLSILHAAAQERWFVDSAPTWKAWGALASVWVVIFMSDRLDTAALRVNGNHGAVNSAALILALRNRELYLRADYIDGATPPATVVAPPGAYRSTSFNTSLV